MTSNAISDQNVDRIKINNNNNNNNNNNKNLYCFGQSAT